jgi:hypothetical protein
VQLARCCCSAPTAPRDHAGLKQQAGVLPNPGLFIPQNPIPTQASYRTELANDQGAGAQIFSPLDQANHV